VIHYSYFYIINIINVVVVVTLSTEHWRLIVPDAEYGRSDLVRRKRTGSRQPSCAALHCVGRPRPRYSLPANRNYIASPIHSHTIRCATFTCAQKSTGSSLIYRTKPKIKLEK